MQGLLGKVVYPTCHMSQMVDLPPSPIPATPLPVKNRKQRVDNLYLHTYIKKKG